jgi:hypothetical protein
MVERFRARVGPDPALGCYVIAWLLHLYFGDQLVCAATVDKLPHRFAGFSGGLDIHRCAPQRRWHRADCYRLGGRHPKLIGLPLGIHEHLPHMTLMVRRYWSCSTSF